MNADTYTLTELARLAIAGGADRQKVERSLEWMPLNEDHRRDLFAVHAPAVPPDYEVRRELKILDDGAGRKREVVRAESEVIREMRWRWEWADLMLAASRKVT